MEEVKEKLHVLHRHGLPGFAVAFVAWLAFAETRVLTFGQPAPPSDNEDGVEVLDLADKNCIEAWLELHPDEPIPEILHYISDRGVWNLESSKEINAYISAMPFEFGAWLEFYTPGAYDCGKAILAFLALPCDEQMGYNSCHDVIIENFTIRARSRTLVN